MILLIDVTGSREDVRLLEQYVLAFHHSLAKLRGHVMPRVTAQIEDSESVVTYSETPTLHISVIQAFVQEKTPHE